MKEYIVKVGHNKTEWYNKEDQLHREDGPAVEFIMNFKKTPPSLVLGMN